MRLYCLAYDSKDSKDAYWNGKNIKNEIVKVLQDNHATCLISPVASTIIFGGKDNAIKSWNKVLSDNFKDKINFFICLVAYEQKNNVHYYRMHPDKDLEASFNKSL